MAAEVFFDTTILIYALAQDDPRAEVAEKLLAGGGRVSVQVLNEFVAVGRKKLGMDWKEIEEALAAIRALCGAPVSLTVEIHEAAVKIAQRYRFHIYDSLIIAAALEAGCMRLYSEDMQDGQKVNSLVIRNPFPGR